MGMKTQRVSKVRKNKLSGSESNCTDLFRVRTVRRGKVLGVVSESARGAVAEAAADEHHDRARHANGHRRTDLERQYTLRGERGKTATKRKRIGDCRAQKPIRLVDALLSLQISLINLSEPTKSK